MDHAHCNGISKQSEKGLKQDVNSLPNGLHAIPNETVAKVSKEVLGKNSQDFSNPEPSAQDKIVKSTTELIDKFSSAMALSLINSNSSNDQTVPPSGEPNSKNEKISITSDNVANDESVQSSSSPADSTVKFPISKTDSSDYVVMQKDEITYMRYESERQMSAIMQLITKDLSEPYSIYTYRYFIHNWPHLCFLAMHESEYVGAIVCKLDIHKKITRRGYIAMLAVDKSVRRKKIGTSLVKMAIETMNNEGCDEVVLETEVTNQSALKLYENLGFVRDKRLFRYYLNGVDALRLKLWLR